MTDEHPLDRLDTTSRILKRAQYEAFAFMPCPEGIRVRNESHADPAAHTYVVTVVDGQPTACTCPADARFDDACKHRVAVAIRPPVRASATDWTDAIESEQPASGRSLADGGSNPQAPGTRATRDETESSVETMLAPADDDRPADCDCAALPGDFPCWPCVRAGRRSVPPADE